MCVHIAHTGAAAPNKSERRSFHSYSFSTLARSLALSLSHARARTCFLSFTHTHTHTHYTCAVAHNGQDWSKVYFFSYTFSHAYTHSLLLCRALPRSHALSLLHTYRCCCAQQPRVEKCSFLCVHTLTHTYTHSLSLSRSLALSLSRVRSLTHNHTGVIAHNTYEWTSVHSDSYTHSLTHIHTLSLALPRALSLSRANSLTHTYRCCCAQQPRVEECSFSFVHTLSHTLSLDLAFLRALSLSCVLSLSYIQVLLRTTDKSGGLFILTCTHSHTHIHTPSLSYIQVLLRTTDKSGGVFIRTDQLDGETDWKLRSTIAVTQVLQCVAVRVCCTVLQCAAVCCGVSQPAACVAVTQVSHAPHVHVGHGSLILET